MKNNTQLPPIPISKPMYDLATIPDEEKENFVMVSNKSSIADPFDHLQKNKFDISYVISLLKTILRISDKLKMNPIQFQFTLVDSVKKLLANLEIEKNQVNNQDRIEIMCQVCSFHVVLHKEDLKNWECPCCARSQKLLK